MASKHEFLHAYQAELLNRYPWALDEGKLGRFMSGCASTIGAETSHGERGWNHSGPAVTAAWKKVGGKGKPSLKALRALA